METTRGFTVLELLVTLAVAAVMLAVAVPSMASMIKQSRLTAAHNELVSSLYLLRSEAAKRNRVVKMCRMSGAAVPACASARGGGWEAGWAIWVDADNNNRMGDDETRIGVHPGFGDGVRLSGNGALVNRLAYLPTGAPAGFNNGTFTVCVEGSAVKRQVIISAAGRIRSRELRSDGSC